MKISRGDTFKIKTKIGFAYMQYLEADNMNIEFVRILDHISENGEIEQKQIDKIERWCIGFPLKAAIRRKIVEFVGNFEIGKKYTEYKYSRIKHNIRGEFLGWHIINKKTLRRELKKKLSRKDLKLSPHGIMNDTLIIKYIESDWKLKEWK